MPTAVLIYNVSVGRFLEAACAVPKSGVSRRWVGPFVPAQTYAVVLMPTLGLSLSLVILWRIVSRKNADEMGALILGQLVGLPRRQSRRFFSHPVGVGAIFQTGDFHSFQFPRASRPRSAHNAAAGTSPCWNNCFIAHDRAFLSAHSGINFWIGNNPRDWLSAFPPVSAGRRRCYRFHRRG